MLADPLPSWNDGRAKSAILSFVQKTTDPKSPDFIPEGERIATFDQDGTLWVEHPMVTQITFAFERVGALAPANPTWKDTEPFKSILTGDKAGMAKFTIQDLMAIAGATHSGVTTADFEEIVSGWVAKARDPRWNRPYTDLVYQPMLEVMQHLRASGFRVYIVTGGGQAFVRAFAQATYDVPPDRVIGSTGKTKYTYNKEGRGVLMKEPDLLFFDDVAAKPEDIYLFLGRRPNAAFGNSDGDRPMLEYAHENSGATLGMLVMHDDAEREYAYGPAQGLPPSKLSPFSQATYDEAVAKGWSVISMKKDWKRIFAFEK
jgi:phosphoglycolate phosphatase-like HAD superfamily hydrolase